MERTAAGGTSGAPQNAAPAVTPPLQPHASQSLQQQQTRRQRGLTEWKALLCTLIADREVKSMRHDAKRLLRRLCITQVGWTDGRFWVVLVCFSGTFPPLIHHLRFVRRAGLVWGSRAGRFRGVSGGTDSISM